MTIKEITTPVIASFDLNGESGITIEKIDAAFRLRWTDYVVNEWEEVYPTLSIAFARASVLIACGESEWEKGFTSRPEEFSKNAADFLGLEAR